MSNDALWPLSMTVDLGDIDPVVEVIAGPAIVRGPKDLPLDDAHVHLDCRAEPRLRCEGSGTTAELLLRSAFGMDDAAVSVEFLRDGARGAVVKHTYQLGGDFRERPYQISVGADLKELSLGGSDSFREVRFALPNFGNQVGQVIKTQQARWRGRLWLHSDDWVVQLDARQDLSKVIRELRRRRHGIAYTHVGALRRADGQPFSRPDALEILDCLGWFLSFARGAWTAPLIVESQNTDSPWLRASARRVDRRHGAFSWLDSTVWTPAAQAFETFSRLWKDDAERQTLRVAIGLYMTANKPSPVEIAISAAQSALELLAWKHAFSEGGFNEDDWKALPASLKLTQLLTTLNADVSIPTRFEQLGLLDHNWQNGPSAVAGVRNRLIHPRPRRVTPPEALIEAWLLATWYLELALLHYLGATGRIRNRLNMNVWEGLTQLPPWVAGDEPSESPPMRG